MAHRPSCLETKTRKDTPLAFPKEDFFTGNELLVNCFLPEQDYSHGKLRLIEKCIQVEWAEIEKDIIQKLESEVHALYEKAKNNKQKEKQHLRQFLKSRVVDSLFDFPDLPVRSLMGADYSNQNGLLVLYHPEPEDEKTAQEMKKQVALLYEQEEKKQTQEPFIQTEKGTTDSSAVLSFSKDVRARKYDPHCSVYVFELCGWLLSGRKGTRPDPVLRPLRIPYGRALCEAKIWADHLKKEKEWQNALVLEDNRNPTKKKTKMGLVDLDFEPLVNTACCSIESEQKWLRECTEARLIRSYWKQVSKHARPLGLLSKKFHPSFPFTVDPEDTNTYIYYWMSLKPLERNFLLDPQAVCSKNQNLDETRRLQESSRSVSRFGKAKTQQEKEAIARTIAEESGAHFIKFRNGTNQLRVNFEIDDFFVSKWTFPSAGPTRRKEKKLKLFWAVSSEWDRSLLFSESDPNYIFKNPLQSIYDLLGNGLPQEHCLSLALMNANGNMHYKVESAKRGATGSISLLDRWHAFRTALAQATVVEKEEVEALDLAKGKSQFLPLQQKILVTEWTANMKK